MPTYHFCCPKGHDFDRFFKTMSSAPLELPCEECRETASRQMSGGAGLVFKGSGFYLTDYGKNAHRGTAPEKKGESAKSETAKGQSEKGEPARADSAKREGAPKAESKADAAKPRAESREPRNGSKPKSE